jgi:hypothetical protein
MDAHQLAAVDLATGVSEIAIKNVDQGTTDPRAKFAPWKRSRRHSIRLASSSIRAIRATVALASAWN